MSEADAAPAATGDDDAGAESATARADAGRRNHEQLEQLSRRLRAERERAGLSLRALAARLDISASALSQIETGRSHPSVASLYAIATELGVPLDSLFEPDAPAANEPPGPPVADARPARARPSNGADERPPPLPPPAPDLARPEPRHDEHGGGPVQRAGSRRTLELESGVCWERLTAAADADVDFLYVTYEPDGVSSDGLIRHGGREYGLVLAGELTVTVGLDEYVLSPGDSICLDSNVPHRLANHGTVPVLGIWAVLRRSG